MDVLVQKIVELMREQENLSIQNGELNHELHMYKSVRVDSKPRTNVIRVGRPPLVNLVNNSSVQKFQASSKPKSLKVPQLLYGMTNVDMTLDEIM